MFGGKLGMPELLLILGIALLIWGPSKLADLGKGMGEGIRNFKGAMKEGEHGPTEEKKPKLWIPKRSKRHAFRVPFALL